ncbi:MAG: hypothetical protein LCH74_20590 [Proteobacteria bacterium]|nr:hypothetical protein [Pseudomonadota bacterium]
MDEQNQPPGISASHVPGTAALVLGILTFFLFFFSPWLVLGLLTSFLAVVAGMIGLTTRGRGRAGAGMVLGLVGGLLCALLFLLVPG